MITLIGYIAVFSVIFVINFMIIISIIIGITHLSINKNIEKVISFILVGAFIYYTLIATAIVTGRVRYVPSESNQNEAKENVEESTEDMYIEPEPVLILPKKMGIVR